MLFEQIPFTPAHPEEALDLASDIPEEFDIFFRSESSFLPDGKSFRDLSREELEHLKVRYRFDPLKPGVYQGLTWIGDVP